MEAELTLNKAKWLISQQEAVKEQQAAMKLPVKQKTTLPFVEDSYIISYLFQVFKGQLYRI